MLEAIFKLLKLEMQVAVAVVTLVSGVALWLLRPLVRRVWNALERSKAQPVPERQDPEVPVAPARAQEVVPVAAPSPEPAPERPAAKTSLRQVLAAPDHALYVTSNSELVIVHPRSDELLDMVDCIGVAALHKDGSPFIQVTPDTSASDDGAAPDAPDDDLVFMDGEPSYSIPIADGKLWVRRLGALEMIT